MSGRLAGLVLGVGLGLPGAVAAQDEAPAPDPPAEVAPVDEGPMAAELRRLAGAHADVARLEQIGVSAQGRPLLVLAIGAVPQGDARPEAELGLRPGLLVADAYGCEDALGAESALRFARHVLEGRARDAQLARLLSTTAIFVAPDLDPDRRAAALGGQDAPRQVAFDANFPSGWLPPTVVAGSGPYPLSMPETRAIAEFLVAHPSIALVHTLTDAEDVRFEDRDELAAALDAQALARPRPAGGTLAAFCALELRRFVSERGFAYAPDGEVSSEPAADLARGYVALALGLPGLEIGTPSAERLGDGLVRVDVPLSNRGRYATAPPGPGGGGPRPELGVLLDVSGLDLVGAAIRREGDEVYRVVRAERGRVRVGSLDGGETAWLRLVVAGAEGERLYLLASAPRAGRAAAQLGLP